MAAALQWGVQRVRADQVWSSLSDTGVGVSVAKTNKKFGSEKQKLDDWMRGIDMLKDVGETEFIRQHQCAVRSLAAFEVERFLPGGRLLREADLDAHVAARRPGARAGVRHADAEVDWDVDRLTQHDLRADVREAVLGPVGVGNDRWRAGRVGQAGSRHQGAGHCH